MSEGEIVGRHYLTQQPVKLRWSGTQLTAVESASAPPQKDCWIAPALTDLQVNGYASVGYGNPALTEEMLMTSVRALNRDGCAQILLTLTTNKWEVMTEKVKRVRGWRAANPALRDAILGFHLEGPFMSPVPGYCGAHPSSAMISPTAAHMRELREAAGDCPVLLTVAPEQAGVVEAIGVAASLGMRVSLGHTNASAADIAASQKNGATSFTHLGNGCPQELDRHDNILWRVMNAPGICAGIIPDLIHVSPMLLRIMHRQLDTRRIWYTTDAVSPAGMPPGRFKFGDSELEVGPDQVVRQPGKTNFAGSALRPLEGIFRAVEAVGCTWQEAWARYSRQPREMMGVDTEQLAAGKSASFCVLDFSKPENAAVSTYVRGELCSTLPARARMNSAGM